MKNITVRNICDNETISFNIPNGYEEYNYICALPYRYICLYNNNDFKIFQNIDGYENEIFEVDIEGINENNILANVSSINVTKNILGNKIYFNFICEKENYKFTFSLMHDLEDIESDKFIFSNIKNIDGVLDVKTFELNNELYHIFIYKDKIELINIFNNINYNVDVSENTIYFLEIEKIKNEELSLLEDGFKYNKNEILFLSKDINNNLFVLFIDFDNNIINKLKLNDFILNTNIEKCIVNLDNYKYIIKILDSENSVIQFEINKNNLTKSIHNLDTELIINSGTESGVNVEIKSNSPSYRGFNNNNFLSNQMNDTTISGISENENENVILESVDNNEILNVKTFKNENELFMDSKAEFNPNIKKQLIDNQTITSKDIFKYNNDQLMNKESVLIQEISDSNKGTVYLLSKNVQDNERNKVIISSKDQAIINNIPIVVDGIVTTYGNKTNNYSVLLTNSCALSPNKNNKYLFPFINSQKYKFNSFTLNRGEIFTAQNVFLNYLSNYKYKKDNNNLLFNNILTSENSLITKLLVYNYLESTCDRKELRSILDNSQSMKTVADVFNSMNIDIVDNKLELSNTPVNKDTIFKYFNEYYGYKFNVS